MKYAALAISLSFVCQALHAGDGLELLRKMSDSMNTVNYSGTFVYRHKDKVETMRIVHGHSSEGISERLITISGKPREVIRNDNIVTCVWPESRVVLVKQESSRSHFPGRVPNNLSKLAMYYDVGVIDGIERIAGRSCLLVEVQPKDEFRYGYRLWIDQDTNLLVRSDLVNEENESVEQVIFTDLDVHEEFPLQALVPEISTEGFEHREIGQLDSESDEPGFNLEAIRLPSGFVIQGRKHRPNKAGTAMAEQFIYSDGLAFVSVFIESSAESEKVFGSKRRGALNVYGKTLDGVHITVVGEVPKKTVQLIADSVTKTNLND